jgi:hypothetical protein
MTAVHGRPLVLGLAPWLGLGGIAGAAATRSDLTVANLLDTLDNGDAVAAGATDLPDVTIIDEVPPYIWRGPTAFADWACALAADGARNGVSRGKATPEDVTGTDADKRRAYVVMAATYNFTDHGKPMHERMTFALRRVADGWKIAGWTWTGPHALPDDPPAKRAP